MIKIDSKNLKVALSNLSKVVSGAGSMPVYKHVLMIIKGDKLVIRGTDLSTLVEQHVSIENKSGDEGKYLVIFDPVFKYISSCSGDVTLDFGKSEVTIKSGGDKASPKLRSIDDFMTWPKWNEASQLNCNAEQLVLGIKRCLVTIASSLISPILFNVCIVSKGGKLYTQSSDGSRFVINEIDGKNKDLTCLIPFTSASKLVECGAISEVRLSPSLIWVKTDTGFCAARLSESNKFPFLPDKVETKFSAVYIIDKDNADEVLSKSIGFSDAQYRRMKFNCRDKIEIVSSSPELGEYRGVIKPVSSKGKGISLDLDGKHFQDAFSFAKDKLVVAFTSSEGPIVFRDPGNKKFIYVAYPLRVEKSDNDKQE